MTDFMTPEQRHVNMSRIKGTDTSPEIFVRKLLFKEGYRYRIQVKRIPGKPDIWLRKYNTAIYVNGCFWHRHENCRYAYMPKSRVGFWEKKFKQNMERDVINRNKLADLKIKCLIIWECSVRKIKKNPNYEEAFCNTIVDFLNSKEMYLEL